MKKKIMSAVLSAIMIVGMSVPSFATDTEITTLTGATDTGAEVAIDSDVSLPVIKITVPTTTSIIINPFRLEVDIDGEGDGEETSNDQIISTVQEISSESNVKLAVNVAQLKATPKDGATIAILAKTAKAATAKSAYLAMEIDGDLSAASSTTKTTVVASTAGAKKDAAYMLDKGTAQTPSTCEFKIVGDVNPNPTKVVSKVTVADPWVSTDEIDIAVKFTFTPQLDVTTP